MTSNIFLLAVGANVAIAIFILIFIFALKIFQEFFIKHIKFLTAITVGVLLYLIFIVFFPELIENMNHTAIGFSILGGILLFYILELFLHWHHCGDLDHKCSHHGVADIHKEHENLMFFGTFIHNFFHGIVIYSSFAISFETGLMLTAVIAMHALPQNLANYVMNHKKIWSIMVAVIGGIIGAILCYPFGDFIVLNKFYILATMSGGLLYLALSDILPSINGALNIKDKVKYFAFVVLGTLLMFAFEHGLMDMVFEAH